MRITLRDGRRELLQNSEQYDLITLEPPPPSAAGVVNLYSSDFYALARSRLAPGGILAQWWPLATQNDEDSRSLVRSFLDIFPYATLWTTELHEMMLVGSLSPLTLDVPRITARFDHPAVSAVLSEVGIRTPAAVLATWMTDRSGLERYARGFEPVTDDRPGIEYATWVRRGEFTRVLPRVLALQSEPPLVGASAEFRLQMGAERQTLLDFYSAALCAYQGDREGWARSISRVIKADPQNAYYSWISGETRP
jgi:spermidine synthase